ncbi:MAG: hypothetical protein PHO32_08225, partial [Candidatus Cloacimonetes bacterium]|nr:hypothetical protein [Candidatus Cloacimonadota bacterium]
FGIGAYYKPRLSFESDYSEEIRNNRNTDNDGYPEKLAQNLIEGKGTLKQTGITASWGKSLGDYTDINFGIDYSVLNGDITREKTIRWTDWAISQVVGNNLPELTETEDYELSGSQIKIGGAVQLNTHFGIAATYIPKTTLTKEGSYYYKRDAYLNTAVDSTNVLVDEDYIMPTEIRVGFAYSPRNVMRTKFNLDVEYVQYSEVDMLNGDPVGAFDDVVNFYSGVEHHVTNRIPFRLGFQAVNNWYFNADTPNDAEGNPIVDEDGNPIIVYYAKKLLTPMITAGSSVAIAKNWTIDLGFGYSWREYEATDMFGDAYYNDKIYTGSSSYVLWPNSHIQLQNRGWENPDKIRENNISLNAGLNFTW